MSAITLVKPCVKCGATKRTNAGACAVCKVAMTAAWVKANPQKAKAYLVKYGATEATKAKRSAWYQANKERIKKARIEYLAANLDKTRKTTAAWRAANPGIRRNQKHVRRARERGVGGRLSPRIAEKLYELQKGKCACCGNALGDNYHLDHVVPLALGGSNTDDNVQLLRQKCNQQKGAKHPVDFMQSKGFLL